MQNNNNGLISSVTGKYSQGDTCVPGKAFYSECNQCVCSTSGKSAFCTMMDCRTKA